MSKREVVVLVCDLCESDDLVDTHCVIVDGHAVELEACDPCWADIMEGFAGVARVGRKVKAKRVKKSEVVPFPGESWSFRHHALIRIGERQLNPVDVAKAADDPEVTHAGRAPGTEVHIRKGIKVVVRPEQRLIITAGDRDEQLA